MGPRTTYRIYKEADMGRVRLALKRAHAVQSNEIDLENDLGSFMRSGTLREQQEKRDQLAKEGKRILWWGLSDTCVTLDYPYLADGGDYLIAQEIGKALNCPWFEVRIQEGNHWDYSFYHGADHIDQFSPDPSYFEEKKSDVKGNPDLVSREWGVPKKAIEKYIRPWRFFRRGKAYPGDNAPYGDYEQFWDFVGRLGATVPDKHCFAIADKIRNG